MAERALLCGDQQRKARRFQNPKGALLSEHIEILILPELRTSYQFGPNHMTKH